MSLRKRVSPTVTTLSPPWWKRYECRGKPQVSASSRVESCYRAAGESSISCSLSSTIRAEIVCSQVGTSVRESVSRHPRNPLADKRTPRGDLSRGRAQPVDVKLQGKSDSWLESAFAYFRVRQSADVARSAKRYLAKSIFVFLLEVFPLYCNVTSFASLLRWDITK